MGSVLDACSEVTRLDGTSGISQRFIFLYTALLQARCQKNPCPARAEQTRVKNALAQLVASLDRLGAAEAGEGHNAMADQVHELLLTLPPSAVETALDACSNAVSGGAGQATHATRLFCLFSDLLMLHCICHVPHALRHLACFFKLTARRLCSDAMTEPQLKAAIVIGTASLDSARALACVLLLDGYAMSRIRRNDEVVLDLLRHWPQLALDECIGSAMRAVYGRQELATRVDLMCTIVVSAARNALPLPLAVLYVLHAEQCKEGGWEGVQTQINGEVPQALRDSIQSAVHAMCIELVNMNKVHHHTDVVGREQLMDLLVAMCRVSDTFKPDLVGLDDATGASIMLSDDRGSRLLCALYPYLNCAQMNAQVAQKG